MNPEQKLLANRAIDESVEDTTARQIIRYVMECELWAQDSVSPSNEHLCKKYGWTPSTLLSAISRAKKSQFITTTGYGKKRCFELNVAFLKGKMAEQYQKTLRPRADFSDILPPPPNTLPNSLPKTSHNTLPKTFSSENGLTEGQNLKKEGDNNNNSNNNLGEDKSSQEIRLVREGEEDTRLKAASSFGKAKFPHSRQVFSWFPNPQQGWKINTTECKYAELLWERGEENVKNALAFLSEHWEDKDFYYTVTKPSDLEKKWLDILTWKRKKGL